MSRAGWIVLAIVVLLLVAGGVAVVMMLDRGFSARDEPTAIETWLARTMRDAAIPDHLASARNPLEPTPEVLDDAMAHWADHCAVCHGNDGRGDTPMGSSMYPPAPDMTLAATQELTDGELFAIIENGVRLTGMPAWGDGDPTKGEGSWGLVHFIRKLPKLTADELAAMERLNPVSRAEIERIQMEEAFLAGEDVGAMPSTGQNDSGTSSHHH